MFDGEAEQFHQFITSRTSLPIPLSPFSLNGSSPPAAAPHQPAAPSHPSSLFPSFEPYPPPHQTVFQPLSHHLHHQLHHHHLPTSKDDKKEDQNSRNSLLESNLVLGQRERSISLLSETSDLWSEDEVLTLLRIKSSMESWYPEFTWEHVSRKFAELGFKRSAEKCKEKFEEESRSFNSLNYNKNYRIYTELDEIYHGENAHVKSVDEKNQDMEKQNEAEREGEPEIDTEEGKSYEANNNTPMENEAEKQQQKISKKRKRKYNFKKIKVFCETIVNQIMTQQEELHNKLIEDILKRDQELIAKEEAWKNQELEKLNKEIEIIRAKQQAIVNDRQPMLLEFLKNFTSDNDSSHKDQDFSKKIEDLLKIINNPSSSSHLPPPGDAFIPQNPNFTSIPSQKISNFPTSSSETPSPQNPSSIIQPTMVPNENSSSTQSMSPQNPNFEKIHEKSKALANSSATSSHNKAPSKGNDDTGKRWPKDEVLALINLRCSFNSVSNCDDNKESGGGKCPLWERISQGMEKIGYRRSAKRCKEKWENINKYFRKTKDNNKKRSIDSRTCPYFHQLSRLYSQGILVAPSDDPQPENRQALPENSHTENTSLASLDVPEGKEELHAAEAGKTAVANHQTSVFKIDALS